MIELDYPRGRMLEDIGADEGLPLVGDLSDPHARADFVALERARALLRARTPAEILPGFDAALAARFSDVPTEGLQRNLLRPVKKAVGNAHKRGNRGASDKWITLEVVVTRRGAFVEVCDQGPGFDVAATLAGFQDGRKYFRHKGSGFRRYAKSRSVVSFAAGGRRFLTRFLCTVDRPPSATLAAE